MIASGEHKLIISSCCHSVNLLIQKRYPQALPYLAKVDSPMLAHARSIKERVPGSAVVFIGPCISKKDEARAHTARWTASSPLTSLSTGWPRRASVCLPARAGWSKAPAAGIFPTAGGILRSMDLDDRVQLYPPSVACGTECIDALRGDRAGRHAELLCGDERLQGQLRRVAR